MSLVVLQLFPTLAPHRAGCMSPLKMETPCLVSEVLTRKETIKKKQLDQGKEMSAKESHYHSHSEKKIGDQPSSELGSLPDIYK